MPALLVLALVAQVRTQSPPADTAKQPVRNVTVRVDSSRDRERREPRRIPVTPEHLRTAFKSAQARDLVLRARVMRMAQDSALMSYEATTYLRISAGMGFAKIGRDRLIFRHENATEVRWHRDVGAWIEVKGARTVIPIAPDEASKEASSDIDTDITPIPYYPGQEPMLSFGDNSESVQSQVDEREIVHPLAEGSEAYYTYAVGDSVTFRLPDGSAVNLREILVRPRAPKWNVAVGSLWFDTRTGQLVRAAYRLAVPMDIWAIVAEEDSTAQDDIPVWVKPLISPMRAQITAMAVEYGLYQGRFWLPRMRSAEGSAQVSFMRVPFKFDQTFKYSSVNALDSLPKIPFVVRARPPDSLSGKELETWRDSVREVRRQQRRASADSIRDGLKVEAPRCDSSNTRQVTEYRRSTNLAIGVRVTCDLEKLASAPELPKSIYDEGDEVFGGAERDALIKEALSMTAQPPFAIGLIPPTLKWGLEYTRYNRIEGLSSAAVLEQNLGAGYTVSLLGRLGVADFQPNFELGLARTNLIKTIRGRAYNRLNSASDWGNPLSFGSSLSAFLFGRDDGFYYRTTGVEVEFAREVGTPFTWRLFAERQRTATPENTFNLGATFIPNLTARTGQYAGASMHFLHSRGLDPNGFRMFTDIRMESAVSDSANAVYGRGALDLTFTKGIGPIAAALTLAGGTSTGVVPMQRRWYLGGTSTVRGQRPDTAHSGNAFWLTRFEVGKPVQGVRPVVFGDIGWVGSRELWNEPVRPMSGVGIGVSMLDGLIRWDLSRGIYPQKRMSFDMYLEAKF
jgi:hypothetical protein